MIVGRQWFTILEMFPVYCSWDFSSIASMLVISIFSPGFCDWGAPKQQFRDCLKKSFSARHIDICQWSSRAESHDTRHLMPNHVVSSFKDIHNVPLLWHPIQVFNTQIDIYNTTSLNWCLHHLFLTDPCNAMVLHRHLYHHGSNGSMSVAVCLKFQLDLRCNLTMRKSDEHTKHCLGLRIQKFIHNYTS